MPKIFVLRDRLAEQQARLRANDKNGVNGGGGNGFPVNLASSSAPAASEDAAGTSQQQQQPLNLQSRPQYVAPKIGKKEKQRKSLSLSSRASNALSELSHLLPSSCSFPLSLFHW